VTLLVLLLAAPAQAAYYDDDDVDPIELPAVEITGSYGPEAPSPGEGWYGGGGYDGPSYADGGNAIGPVDEVEVASVTEFDVCKDPKLSDTTSKSDVEQRMYAARVAFIKARGPFVPNGALFTMKYGDGGSETFTWIGFARASTMNGHYVAPVPGSLREGPSDEGCPA
jgi:hypothetical protein